MSSTPLKRPFGVTWVFTRAHNGYEVENYLFGSSQICYFAMCRGYVSRDYDTLEASCI